MKSSPMGTLATWALVALPLAGCSSKTSTGSDGTTASAVQAVTSTGGSGGSTDSTNTGGPDIAGLQLQVLTNSCGQNQAQQFFQVVNTGTTAVKLSDISIKFWINDTTGQAVVPNVWYGGCVTGVGGDPSCVHQVVGVTPARTSISACGPDANHLANWEVTITNTDDALLPPGATWSNLQSALNLANYGDFSPGASSWYSPCLMATTYAYDPRFVLYYQGQFSHTPDVQVPSCRGGHSPFDFVRSPIEIDAWKNLSTGEDHPSEVTLTHPVDIQIPGRIWVTSGGNAGQGQLTLQYRNGTGSVDTCTYMGISTAHPDNEVDRALGLEYYLQGCSSGATKDQLKQATWVKVTVVSGDADAGIPVVGVKLALGGGCSGTLEPDLSPFEVTLMREGFHWNETNGLEPNDPDGNPAMWQGMIYIEREEQLQWLDQLSVFWSDRPLDAASLAKWNGKCGKVPHSADSKGKVVYAVFPALFYNIMRTNGIQADQAGVAPLFKFIVPSAPKDTKYVNSDGSLAYQGLADSGYLQWLGQHSPSSPCWCPLKWGSSLVGAGESIVSGVKTDITKVYDWGNSLTSSVANTVTGGFYGSLVDLVGGIPGPLSTPGDVILSTYSSLGNIWTKVKTGLGNLAELACGSVHVNMNLHIQERDAMLNGTGNWQHAFLRMWGPQATWTPYNFGRPEVYPVGATVTINQWGCGFIPSENEATVSDSGFVGLQAVKGASVIGDGLCLELKAPYAMMTSDVGPDTVCNFNTGDLGWAFSGDWSGDVSIDQAHTYTLTQLEDAGDYARDVIGYQPNRANILVGSLANKITHAFNKGNPLTACLTFPGLTSDLIGLASQIPGIVIPPAVSEIAADILKKDIFWPDSAGPTGSVDSRGVVTHEYGHFNQCSLAYQDNGPGALDGLLSRVTEGSNHSRSSERTIMLETFADTFAMQVTGGANYIHPQGSTDRFNADPGAAMGWCTSSPCMDFNYAGAADYRSGTDDPSQFLDELARWESLVYDSFDRVDSLAGWFSSNTTNSSVVSNGDIWKLETIGSVSRLIPATSPFIMNDDEPVSLHGTAFRDWVSNWLARGKSPTKQNIIGGLVDTIKKAGYNWCDTCEVLAPHYASTPTDARMANPANPTGQTRTMAIRTERWDACSTDSEMTNFLGAAPNNHGNMLSNCSACPALSHPDDSGSSCVACDAGWVPRGTGCIQCDKGAIAGSDNECHACASNQITSGNTCITCPGGTGADRASNTCKPCPIDVSITLPCQTDPACGQESVIPINYSEATNDICPTEFWLEMTGFATCRSSEVFIQTELPSFTSSTCSNATGNSAVYSPGAPAKFLGGGTGPFQFSSASCLTTSGGKYCFNEGCSNPMTGTIVTAGYTTLWATASITENGAPISGNVTIRTPDCLPQ